MASAESTILVSETPERKRVDWTSFKPRISTNETKIVGLESARYGLDKPEYNINKADVLYTIWCNSLRLLDTRGYGILPELRNLVSMDYTLEYVPKFRAWINKYLTIARNSNIDLASTLNSYYTRSLPDGRIEVIHMMYVDYSNPKTRAMSETKFDDIIIYNDQELSKMNMSRYTFRLMVISAGDWNTASRKLGANKEYPVELVKWDRFYNNPLENVLAVKYQVLTTEERNKYFLDNDRLPAECCTFTADDPVVFWYNWPPGTLVRIFRDDPYLTNICDVRCEYRIVSSNLNPARKV